MKNLLGIQVGIRELGVTEFLILTSELWNKIYSLDLNKVYIGEFESGEFKERAVECSVEVVEIDEFIDMEIEESDRDLFYHTIDGAIIANDLDIDLESELNRAEFSFDFMRIL